MQCLSISKDFTNQLRATLPGTKRQSLYIPCLFPNPARSGAEKLTGDPQGHSLALLGFHSVHFFDEYQRSEHSKVFYQNNRLARKAEGAAVCEALPHTSIKKLFKLSIDFYRNAFHCVYYNIFIFLCQSETKFDKCRDVSVLTYTKSPSVPELKILFFPIDKKAKPLYNKSTKGLPMTVASSVKTITASRRKLRAVIFFCYKNKIIR